jgi:F0F1-type ATP synthase assembly protein I
MKNQSSLPNSPWWQPGLLLFFRLSGYIGVPVIIGAYVGRWLDNKYHSDPWLFLICVGVSFIVSMVGLVREALKEFKRIEDESKKAKTDGDKPKI